MAVTNPFLLAFRGIWTILEADTDLIGSSGLIPSGNCVKTFFQEDEDGSSYRRLPARRSIQYTGEQQADKLCLVQWQTIIAMSKWRDTLSALTLPAVGFSSATYIFDCGMMDFKDSVELDREIKGWRQAWHGYVDMVVSQSAIIAA